MADIRLTSDDGGIRHLTLDAPQRRNALDTTMLAEMAAAVREVRDDREARVLVVSGNGRSFCAGADLSSLFGDPTRAPAAIRDDLKQVYASFLGITDLTIPSIAAVHGQAVGAGVNIALACDVVVAAPDASFAVTFAEIGLHPGGGCSWLLTRRLGPGKALDVILSADRLSGTEAARLGLVTRLSDDPVGTAQEMAKVYAGRELGMLRNMKRAVTMSTEASLATVLEFESWAQASSVNGERFHDFLARFAPAPSSPAPSAP